MSMFVCFVWAEATSNIGMSCQSNPGSHIKSVLVNPFQSRSSLQTKTRRKKSTTKGMTASEALPSFTPEELPKHAMHTHTYTNPPYTHKQHMYKIKKNCIWLSGVSSLGLSTQKARRVAELSTCLILASPC